MEVLVLVDYNNTCIKLLKVNFFTFLQSKHSCIILPSHPKGPFFMKNEAFFVKFILV